MVFVKCETLNLHSNITATRTHNWNLDQHSPDEAMHGGTINSVYRYWYYLMALNLASDSTISRVLAVCDVYNINNK